MKILVYGATGSQQNPVIPALLKKNHQVWAITHAEKNLFDLKRPNVTPVLADMSDYKSLVEVNKGIDAVSLLIPFFIQNPLDGLEYAKNAINAAKENNVKFIVWNTSGFILPVKIGNPALDVRIDIHNYLKDSGIPYITIQPSVYAENLLGPWTAPFVKNQNKVAYPTPTDMPIGWIATQDVAAFVAQAIDSPHLAGSDFQVSGLDNITGEQLGEKFSKALDKDITYFALPPKDFGSILDQLFGEGAGKGAETMYQEIHDTKNYPVMYAPNMKSTLEKLPIEMTSIEVWVVQHQSYFLS